LHQLGCYARKGRCQAGARVTGFPFAALSPGTSQRTLDWRSPLTDLRTLQKLALAQELGQEFTQERAQGLSQELGQELTQELGQVLTQERGQELSQELG